MELDPGFIFDVDRFPASRTDLGQQSIHRLLYDVVTGHGHDADRGNQVTGILGILGGETQ